MPAAESPPPQSRNPRQVPRPGRWFPWTSLMLVSGVFLGVYAFLEYPREIGSWYLAAAREHWRNAEYGLIQGDLSLVADNKRQAFANLEEALNWSQDEPTFLLQRAEWKVEFAQYEQALSDTNRLLERFPNERKLLRLRAKTLHLLGRHDEAVKDAERVNNLSKTSGNPPRAQALNELAYAKAIGKIELESALQEINEALKSEKNEAYLDTRGFIYYQMGKYDLALKDLDPAANGQDRLLQFLVERTVKERRNSPDIRRFELDLRKTLNEPTAVIHYHRALAHEKLGHATAAAADRKRVRELIGRDGDEKLF